MKAVLLSCGFIITGPKEEAWVSDEKKIRRKREALAKRHGFDPEDYAANEVFVKGWMHEEGLTQAQRLKDMTKRLPRNWDKAFKQQAAAELTTTKETPT